MKSRKFWQVTILLCGLVSSLSSFAGTRDYQTGKLVDVGYDDFLHSGSSQRHAIYQVRLSDVTYSAEGDKLKHTADPTHGLVVGEDVRVAIEGDHLYLRRPDGKEIKTTIVKRERAPTFWEKLFSKK